MADPNKPTNVGPAGSVGMQHVLTPALQQQLLQQQAQAQAAGTVRPAQPMLANPQMVVPSPSTTSSSKPGMTLNLLSQNAGGQMTSTAFPVPAEYVAQRQALINSVLKPPNNMFQAHWAIFNDYKAWEAARAAAGGASSAKRPKVDPMAALLAQQQAALLSAAGGRPPLPPMGMPGMPQATAAQLAAAAQAQLQAGLAQRRAQFAPIVRPTNEDDKQYVPKQRLQALVKQVGQGMQIANAKSTDDADEALRAVAEDFISGAVSFAVAMARRRKAEEVEPADLLLYLERTWSIQVPGFSSKDVKPYARAQPSADHQRRMAAVRKAMATAASSAPKDGAAAGEGAAAGGAGAVPQGAGAASGNAAPGAGVGTAQPAATGDKAQTPPKPQQQQQQQAEDMPDGMAAAS